MVLLGNKGDMVHLRQVSSEEGGFRLCICQTRQKYPQIVRRHCCLGLAHFYFNLKELLELAKITF